MTAGITSPPVGPGVLGAQAEPASILPINLATQVTGVLPVANGGTGQSNLTSLSIGAAASLVTITGGTTGTPASTVATGTDTNIVGVGVGPKGAGAFQLQVTDSTAAGGNSRGTNAFDGQMVRSAATQVASGANAVLLGNNSTSSSNSSVAIGGFNLATSVGSVAIGSSVTASGTRGAALGYQATDRSRVGSLVHANGQRAAAGDAQAIVSSNLRGTTTDAATGVRLTTDAAAAGTTNVINLANNTALRFRILLVAAVPGTSAQEWTIDGLVRRGANAASTAFPTAAVIVSTFGDAGLATCAVACTADTTNGGINITVNGVVATTIQWVANVRGVEVG